MRMDKVVAGILAVMALGLIIALQYIKTL